MNSLNLNHDMFKRMPFQLFKNDNFTVTTFVYESGIEGIKLENSRGALTILPFHGLIIWDAVFDNISLKMKDMFKQPLPGPGIADTYGCFQFTSGLLANGTPGPDDNYQLHGEFPTSEMDNSYLDFSDNAITIHSSYEYVKGFGYHYLAEPAVTIHKDSGLFDIQLKVTNLSNYQSMPLQYLCHMNYAYVANAKMTANVPDNAFQLRQTIPGHVHPTPEWAAYNDRLKASGELINKLDDPNHYDPEIVFFSSNLTEYVDNAEFRVDIGEGKNFLTTFSTKQFPIGTRWILYNPDQQVNAFVIPGTSTPEGFVAAKKAGTLIMLKAHESREFKVTTGLEK